MKVYQLRVSIIGLARVYRIIEASEDCTLDDLHDEIFDAFDRFDPHLYSFFITRKDTDSFRAIYDAPEFTHPDNTEPFMGEEAKDSAAETRIGDIGLKALEHGKITSQQIESARVAIMRHIKRGGKVWIRIFPDYPTTSKPAEVRMGKGKGSVEYWVATVKPGRIMFEIGGLPDDVAVEALRLAQYKLSIKTKIVSREMGE